MNISIFRKFSLISLLFLLSTPGLASAYDTLGRYDVVSYFQISSNENPKKGSKKFTHKWGDKTWYFSSAKNKQLFAADPEKYVPAYDGYCAYAVGNNYTYSSDPLAWTVKDDRLFLNYSKSVREDWLEKSSYYITQGDKNWKHLKK